MAAPVVRHPHARNTSRAYDSDWDRFVTWCKQHRHRPLPAAPPVVAGYLQDAAQARNADGEPVYASATLRRWVAAIADRHRMSQHPSPTANAAVLQAVSAITEAGTTTARPARPAAPLLTADIAAMIAAARKDVTGWAGEVLERRDSALLLMGFAGALGRGGLVAMSVRRRSGEHLHDGLGSAHTAQRSQPHRLPYPVNHTTRAHPARRQRWMQRRRRIRQRQPRRRHPADQGQGPLEDLCASPRPAPRPGHRCSDPSARTETSLSHRYPARRSIWLSGAGARLAGYDDDFVAGLGAQSLRAGFIAQALRNKADAQSILRQTGHIGHGALQRYAPAEPDVHNAVTGLGL